jgi:hypothetical protein
MHWPSAPQSASLLVQAEQAFEAAQSSAVAWQASLRHPPSAAAGAGHADHAAQLSAWGAWGPSSSAAEPRQGPADDESGADPAAAAVALQRRKAELDAMLERVTRAAPLLQAILPADMFAL